MTTVTLNPTGDTFIRSDATGTNYGTELIVVVGENNATVRTLRGLIKFDLSGIPSSAVIQSVTLRLKVSSDVASNARTMRVFRQLRAWVELQATWNVYKTGSSWQTAGGFGANDCEQTDIGSVTVPANATGNWYEVELTASAIQEIIDGTWTDNGFFLKNDNEVNDAHQYSSREDVDPPQLVIDYSVGGRQFQAILIE